MGFIHEVSPKVRNEIVAILENEEKEFKQTQRKYTRRGLGILATGLTLSGIALLWGNLERPRPSVQEMVDAYYSALQVENTAVSFIRGTLHVDSHLPYQYLPTITQTTEQIEKPVSLLNPLLFTYAQTIFFVARSPSESRLLFYPYTPSTQHYFRLATGETIGTQPVQNGKIKRVTSLTDKVGPLFFAKTQDMPLPLPVGRARR